MKKIVLLVAFLCVCVFSQAGVISVGLDYVSTAYDVESGELSMSNEGLVVILVNDDDTQDYLDGADFEMTTSRVSGFNFAGGVFELTNADASTVYISGTVESVVFDYSDSTGTLSGSGQATVLVENLEGNLLGPAEIVTVTFYLDDVVDFESDFEGKTKINVLIPEPATLAILGLGSLMMIRRKK